MIQKAVFSFWSAPFRNSLWKSFSGFPSKEDFKNSFELAIICAKKSFPTVQLVTDSEGYEILVTEMGLPFDTVSLALDGLHEVPSDLWALGKLVAYSIQTEPFVHIDYDFFLGKKVSEWFYNAPIIVQSDENFSDCPFYEWIAELVEKTHHDLPPEWFALHHQPFKDRYAYNAGVLGGNEWEHIRNYAQKIINLVFRNLEVIKALPTATQNELNIVYEQLFFANYCQAHRLRVHRAILNICDDNELKAKQFVHLIGSKKMDRKHLDKLKITLGAERQKMD